MLIEILLQVATIPSNFDDNSHNDVPAFRHTYQVEDDKMIGALQAHPRLYGLLESARGKAEKMLTFEVRKLPMVVPPRPWCSSTEGGYLAACCKISIVLLLYLMLLYFSICSKVLQ